MSEHLSAAIMARVSQLIESRTALHFPPDRWNDLEQKLKFVAKEFGHADLDAFCDWLTAATLNTEQAEILASHLTVSETYFWREPHVFDALEDKILPELIRTREKGEKRLRIWSAGCATGEEPYSLAVAVKRAIPDYKNWNITILATDINPRILRRATEGIYGEWSFRNSPAWLKDRYFSRIARGKYEISSEIRNMVTFAYLNLAEDTYPSPINNTNAMDIIFCRNVLMYFAGKKIQQIGESLFQSLVRDGWFMVSASELSLQFYPQFTPVHFPEAIVYRKTDQKPADNTIFQPSPLPTESAPLHFWGAALLPAEKTSPSVAPVCDFVLTESDSQQVLAQDAVAEKPKIVAADVTGQVRELANQGNLNEALLTCERLILENKLDPNLYFFQATILQEQNRDLEAITALKRALYLDPDFYMGHFALGNLMLHRGKRQVARKCFENALVILAKFNQNDVLPESEGLTAGRMREIVSATIRAGALT